MTGELLPYAQYVIYFTAGFLILPTGRDFILPGKPILPGDKELLDAMNRDPIANPCGGFMWRVFGFNFMCISIVKMMVVSGAMMNFAALFAVADSVGVVLLATHFAAFKAKKADITPFLALFILEAAAFIAIVVS